MKTLLIVLPRQPRTTGNHVSAERFSLSLQKLGWRVRMVAVAETEVEPINRALQQRPDVVLLLNAYRSGRPWQLSQGASTIPFAVLMTGTDLNQDLKNSPRAEIINRILSGAGAIIIQNQLARDELLLSAPPWRDKLWLLPPGIILGDDRYPLRETLKLASSDLLMVHPASIRPVKGNLELLQLASGVLSANPRIHLAYCGPILDQAYGELFLNRLKKEQRASYLGEIPCAAMADVLRQADLVLNNSSSEGMSNALVEAVSLGRPILASDIQGNRSLVQNGINGMLFSNQQEFEKWALRFLDDAALRQRLSQPEVQNFSAAHEGFG